jgi:imidazolonepropionase
METLELLVRNTSEVLTVEGSHTEPAERALTPRPNACVGVRRGKVWYVGPEGGLPPGAVGPSTRVIDAHGQFVGPGFVDPHTHAVFAGERASEFDLRNQGATYLQIAQAGGGIANTVRATRFANEEDLIRLALPRLQLMLEYGITTAEVKSGYGLNLQDELKILKVVQRLSALQPLELVPTLMCAHAVPEEYREWREAYMDLCIREIIPTVAEQGLARFCDVFVEQSAFSLSESRRILVAAQKLGAATADHLENVSDAGIRALADAGVTAVLVPTSTLFLRVRPYAPGRKLREAGVNVALGTNLNPGSAMSENLPLAMGLACLENGLTAAEAYWAVTRGAALALGLNTYGRITVGDPANLVVFSCSNYRHLPYHLGINHARIVIKDGHVVIENERALCP